MYFLDFLEKGKPLSNNEYELPVHIATNLQYISDEDPNSATKQHGKSRLKQYLNCLKEYGISRLLEGKPMTYLIDFVKYHLIPGKFLTVFVRVDSICTKKHKMHKMHKL